MGGRSGRPYNNNIPKESHMGNRSDESVALTRDILNDLLLDHHYASAEGSGEDGHHILSLEYLRSVENIVKAGSDAGYTTFVPVGEHGPIVLRKDGE